MNTQRARDMDPPSRDEGQIFTTEPEHESHKDGVRKVFPYSVREKISNKAPGR